MAGSNDFTGQNIQDSYQRVLQISSSGQLADGTGSAVTLLYVTASHAISASHEITYELSASHAETADDLTGLTTTVAELNYLDGLIENEANQIKNINTKTITNDQWGYVGNMNQNVAKSNNIQFNDITATGNISASGTNRVTAPTGSFHHLVGDTSKGSGLQIDGNLSLVGDNGEITASGAISLGHHLTVRNQLRLLYEDAGVSQISSSGTLRLNASGIQIGNGSTFALGQTSMVRIDGGVEVVQGSISTNKSISAGAHISASGDISSSGNIYGNDLIAIGELFTVGTGVNKIEGILTLGSANVPGGGNNLRVAGTSEFTSHITSSGNISSSGNVYAADYFDDGTNINTLYDLTPTGTISSSAQLPSGIFSGSAQLPSGIISSSAQLPIGIFSGSAQLPGGIISSSFQNLGNITGSNISASGTISGSKGHFEDGITLGSRLNANQIGANGNVGNTEYGHLNGVTGAIQTQFNNIVDVTGSYAITGSDVTFNHITASGHISSSGNVYVADYFDNGANINTLYAPVLGSDDNYVTDAQATVIGNTSNTNSGDQNISNLAVTGSDVIFNHITASGNISSSGTITAPNYTGQIMVLDNMGCYISSADSGNWYAGKSTGKESGDWNGSPYTDIFTVNDESVWFGTVLPVNCSTVGFKGGFRVSGGGNVQVWIMTGSRSNHTGAATIPFGFGASASVDPGNGQDFQPLDIPEFPINPDCDFIQFYVATADENKTLRGHGSLFART